MQTQRRKLRFLPHPPLLIWRMLLGEVGRLTALSAFVLISTMVFVLAVRPLASGQLGPLGALKLMALATLPMLQFAMPFAAGFASTLTYHRLMTDNESIAARAGGMPHRSLLAPAAMLGAVMALALAALTTHVIPRFFQSMEGMIKQDAVRLILSGVQHGKAVNIKSLLVHADSAFRVDPSRLENAEATSKTPSDTSGLHPDDLLVLDGVQAIRSDADGEITLDISARRAELWLQSGVVDGKEATLMQIRLYNAIGQRRGEAIGGGGVFELRPIVFPRRIGEKLKFRTNPELTELEKDPDKSESVAQRRRALAGAIVRSLDLEEMRASLGAEGRLVLLRDDGERAVIRAAGLERDGERWRLLAPANQKNTAVDWIAQDGSLRQERAGRGWLSFVVDERRGVTLVDLDLEDVEVNAVSTSRIESIEYERLRLSNDPAPAVFAISSHKLLSDADLFLQSGYDDEQEHVVRGAQEALRMSMVRLRRQISGERQERLAYSAACFLMTITGAVIALWLKNAMTLVVYLWSFFPALASIITIAGGENIMQENSTLGSLMIWSGIAGLTIYTGSVYMALRRN